MSLAGQVRRLAAREAALLVPDGVLRAARRGAGLGAPRDRLGGRRVQVVGTGDRAGAVTAELGRLGADVRSDHEPHAVVVVADAPLGADGFDACAAAAHERYLGVVRVSLSALPALRRRGRGQLVVLSPTERPADAAAAAARAAIDAHLDCATPELLRDGVTLTHVRVPADAPPDRAARAVVEALVHRPRRLRSGSGGH